MVEKRIAPEEVRQKLREIVHAAALKRLDSTTRGAMDFSIRDVNNPDDFMYGYWMSFILLSGKDLQLTFKTHFFSDCARHLVAAGLKKDPEVITPPNIMDFMREYCNLVAGEVKANLAASEVVIGLSLPLITRGFDEVIFSDEIDARQVCDWWDIEWGDSMKVTCSFVAEVYHIEELSDLKSPDTMEDSEGDIDFL